MPILDLPLEELKKYEGINPCPEDIDKFWDSALAEMRSVEPSVELIPAAFQVPFAECYHLYFTGVRGARIHAKYLRPKNNSGPHPAVVQFHGYSVSSGDWADKLGYVAAGFSVAAMDCRGQGGLSQDVGGVKGNTLHGHIIRGLNDCPKNMLFRHVFLDAAQLASIVMDMPEVDEERVGAMGGSQGGGLTLACAALEPRIKRLAPIYPFLCDYQRVWEMDLAADAYAELRDYFRLFDPVHKTENEVFTKLGYIDNQHIAKRIKGEVVMAVGLMDRICPPSTQFAAYNKITAPKSMIIYPDFGHEWIPGFGDSTYEFMLGL
ncbi:cephalosporin-C deacetylase [Anaerobacterium chartisolvens]|uniref:Cephalosporin-C deacetylase n=1 Tax=Anaerobacterium chartisolvens TaxID=1297424 RepID=A0A369B7Y3_9FIRM|nr:acetylxylan esterase [Anaerobacterium chartisolvens]RCX16647.1 cephalosporin-C deacetylase [Anaerobacterium chartisolvens]